MTTTANARTQRPRPQARDEVIFGGLALDLAPAGSMALVADVIARWSSTQVTLGNVFAELIGVRTPAAVSIYARFDGFQSQRKMLEVAALELLPKKHGDVFLAAMEVIAAGAKERHQFAHWLWGVRLSKVRSGNHLLLADPKKILRLRTAQIGHVRRAKIADRHAAFVSQPRLDQRQLLVFKEDDLRAARRRMLRVEGYAHALEDLVRATPKQRLPIGRALRAESEIRLVLEKALQTRTGRQKDAPKPPRVSSRARREAALAKGRPAGE